MFVTLLKRYFLIAIALTTGKTSGSGSFSKLPDSKFQIYNARAQVNGHGSSFSKLPDSKFQIYNRKSQVNGHGSSFSQLPDSKFQIYNRKSQVNGHGFSFSKLPDSKFQIYNRKSQLNSHGISFSNLPDSKFQIYNRKSQVNSHGTNPTKDQLYNDKNITIFFLGKDLHRGSSMNLEFVESLKITTLFLPRQVADSIPFSSKSVPEILNKFSLKPQSEEAETIKKTIAECEMPGTKGEDKYCATSLESMIDFTTSKLGKDVRAVSTEAEKIDTKIRKYTIKDVAKLNTADKVVSCHKEKYPYAVFYCHTSQSNAYMTNLAAAEDEAKAKAVAVCHKDTSQWDSEHLAFQLLKVKPGTAPICHFLPEDHIIWVPK
ncbi:BURP domain-containing protein 6-like [Coffea arabica]|uniref:BURP domain-containing protein 6-like n=1 Tax=Coffea arabica TaxID=13443 RepID=A0ABM4VFR3_COFAR|nr:BURP domain protein RD22-like [Coffea arabica]